MNGTRLFLLRVSRLQDPSQHPRRIEQKRPGDRVVVGELVFDRRDAVLVHGKLSSGLLAQRTNKVSTTTKLKPAQLSEAFVGRWRITSMLDFDKEALDELEPANIEFLKGGRGTFEFCCVHGDNDASYSVKLGNPWSEFSWMGHDEGDDVHGGGSAGIGSHGIMNGTISFALGDTHKFTAEKDRTKKTRSRKSSSDKG